MSVKSPNRFLLNFTLALWTKEQQEQLILFLMKLIATHCCTEGFCVYTFLGILFGLETLTMSHFTYL